MVQLPRVRVTHEEQATEHRGEHVSCESWYRQSRNFTVHGQSPRILAVLLQHAPTAVFVCSLSVVYDIDEWREREVAETLPSVVETRCPDLAEFSERVEGYDRFLQVGFKLPAVPRLRALGLFDFTGAKIDDATIDFIAANYRGLRVLDLMDGAPRDYSAIFQCCFLLEHPLLVCDDLAHISCSYVRYLNMSSTVDAKAMSEFLASDKSSRLSCLQCSAASLALVDTIPGHLIAASSTLRELEVIFNAEEETTLDFVASFPCLTSLIMHVFVPRYTGPSAAIRLQSSSLNQLRVLTSLTWLELRGVVEVDDFSFVAALPQLEYLNCDGIICNSECLAPLAAMPKIKYLKLSHRFDQKVPKDVLATWRIPASLCRISFRDYWSAADTACLLTASCLRTISLTISDAWWYDEEPDLERFARENQEQRVRREARKKRNEERQQRRERLKIKAAAKEQQRSARASGDGKDGSNSDNNDGSSDDDWYDPYSTYLSEDSGDDNYVPKRLIERYDEHNAVAVLDNINNSPCATQCLEELTLWQLPLRGRATLERLTNVKNLRRLSLACCEVKDRDVTAIVASCGQTLRTLEITDWTHNDSLKRLKNLITDQSVALLPASCPLLTEVQLYATQVTWAGTQCLRDRGVSTSGVKEPRDPRKKYDSSDDDWKMSMV